MNVCTTDSSEVFADDKRSIVVSLGHSSEKRTEEPPKTESHGERHLRESETASTKQRSSDSAAPACSSRDGGGQRNEWRSWTSKGSFERMSSERGKALGEKVEEKGEKRGEKKGEKKGEKEEK